MGPRLQVWVPVVIGHGRRETPDCDWSPHAVRGAAVIGWFIGRQRQRRRRELRGEE